MHILLGFLAFATAAVRSQITNLPPVIVESPKSLLVSVNTNAVFTCQAYCIPMCSIYWIINGTTANQHHRSNFEQHFGFSFSREEPNNNTYTVRLAIEASVTVNDTKIQCEVFLDGDTTHNPVKSSHANLTVIAESPIFPNPSILTQSNCTLLLQWSPPFLWPGHHIQSYDITIANMNNDSSIVLDMLNATSNDVIVSYYVYPINNIRSETCQDTGLLFGVTAINNYAEILSTVYVERQHPAMPGGFFNSSITISVMFTTLLTPIITLSIQLSEPTCNFQGVNYTILISDMNGSDIVAEFGPYHHQLGSELDMAGIVYHDISSGLLRDKEYSLNVTFITFTCVSTSDSYYFDTKFEGDLTRQACESDSNAQLSYQVAAGMLLGIFLLAILVLLLTFAGSKTQQCSEKCSKTRLDQSMVHNPIYSGPEYESIMNHPQYETLQLVPQHHNMPHSIPEPKCGKETIQLQS